MDLRFDNQKYEKHDKENSFVGQFTKQAARSLKQWKEGLSEPLWTVFIQAFADRLSDQIVKTVLGMKLSLLGALFFENAVTKLKKFF
jgi:hypothetical protein